MQQVVPACARGIRLHGPGPDCHNVCTNGDISTITHYQCNLGQCVDQGFLLICDPYACDENGDFCYDSCQSDLQCAGLHLCIQQLICI